jgi:hypothetical protein
MGERHCIRHPDRPAVGNCYQCHKPLCSQCCYTAPGADGLFCNQGCYDQYLAYQGRKRPEPRPFRLKRLVIALLLLAAIAAGAIFIGGAQGIPVLKSIRDALTSSGRR